MLTVTAWGRTLLVFWDSWTLLLGLEGQYPPVVWYQYKYLMVVLYWVWEVSIPHLSGMVSIHIPSIGPPVVWYQYTYLMVVPYWVSIPQWYGINTHTLWWYVTPD